MPLKGLNNVNTAVDNLVISKNNGLRKEFIKTFRSIITGTPVDQGRARANWFLSNRSPSTKTTSSTAPSNAANKVPKKVTGKKTFLTNNLPYIETLEYGGFPKSGGTSKTSGGYSIQAPGGWVRKAIIKLQSQIKLI